ncbi:SusD-like starch-binding protein associating with outer membrane [Chitinophaga skermanii]|uniref:SusD-like starch-binding protein associating with outer membrane n=1 Tax=Chitinophaga skermanii TaxID=331697 RepID=A0A327R5Y8_9BACT|nr:RagB/SusD family nutrient uptake outer membrane protein [Chitinophaga skermanii]RAJ11104.1 SusD-like starch-binding protein associating with outer membrane [Chitinophaga skermanii]
MKNFLLICMLLWVCSSCSKILDIKPQTQIDLEELFSNEQGFKEALNGVYTSCAGRDLYGGNLTFGNLDVLAQNYQFASDVNMQNTANFDYYNGTLRGMAYSVWTNAYKSIANCNYILAYIDNDTTKFSGTNYSLIKGETIALRAYLHFDMLRMFAPSFKSGPTLRGIPFVTQISTTSTPFSTVKATLDTLVSELNRAKELLKKSDPILLPTYVVGYPSSTTGTELKTPDMFLQNRRHRMNYYTVCGELARVYLYKGDYTNALANAEEVIKAKKFLPTKEADVFQTDVEKKDRIMYNELMTAWFVDTKNIQDMLISTYSNSNPSLSGTTSQVNDIYEIAGPGGEDWRLKQWFRAQASATGGTERAILLKYVRNAEPLKNMHPLVAPAMRLTEMYYIAAEASMDTNPAMAVEYYNTARKMRGIGMTLTNMGSRDNFLNLLMKEARKEFYGESQMFYMYKRLHANVVISSTQVKQPSNNVFVFPLPDDENAYRNN